MENLIESAVKILVGEIKSGMAPDAALKITQAVLNLSHAEITLQTVQKNKI